MEVRVGEREDLHLAEGGKGRQRGCVVDETAGPDLRGPEVGDARTNDHKDGQTYEDERAERAQDSRAELHVDDASDAASAILGSAFCISTRIDASRIASIDASSTAAAMARPGSGEGASVPDATPSERRSSWPRPGKPKKNSTSGSEPNINRIEADAVCSRPAAAGRTMGRLTIALHGLPLAIDFRTNR